ncbi:MAG TPA: glycosyltransferase family 39 protein [Bryobacteraceae bacterium]|nr:glycosyltransferase family 39 protein [Bryobacteraceae bacterium]
MPTTCTDIQHPASVSLAGAPAIAELAAGSTHLWPAAILAAITGLSRYVCRSHLLYDIDSVNFALAMDHFDPARHQPHPPGYFLYVCAARALNALFGDANASLVALSILASCGAVVLIYLLTCDWFGRRAGIFAGAIFVFSPLCWFHGTVALTYIVEVFFSTLVGYLCWRGQSGQPSRLLAAAVALGIAAGFRPSSLLFLGPLWLFSAWKAAARVKAAAASLLALTLLAWWIPMAKASGGLRTYFEALLVLWAHVPGKQGMGIGAPVLSLARIATIMGIAILCFGCAAALVFRRDTREDSLRRKKRIFTFIWMGPAFLFFSLVFLVFVNSGYILIMSPPAFAWLGVRAADWFAQERGRRPLRIAVVAVAAVLNVAIFLFAPLYCSFQAVRHFEAELSRVTAAVRRTFKPQDTLIVGFDSHFLGYRHAAYYLPEFLSVEAPAVLRPGGQRIFAVYERKTTLTATIPVGRFRQFAIFPLPGGSDYYRAYMEKQQGLFPPGVLHSQGSGPAFVTGPIASLKYLFPEKMLDGAGARQ